MEHIMKIIMAVIVIGLLGGLAVGTLATTSTSGWGTLVATYWPYLAVVAVVALIIVLLAIAYGAWVQMSKGGGEL